MSKKNIYIIIVVACTLSVGLIWNMMKQAEEASAMSDGLMQQFKAVDESLQRSHDSIESSGSRYNDSLMLEMEKKTGAGQPANP
jgi:hypothetical protein